MSNEECDVRRARREFPGSLGPKNRWVMERLNDNGHLEIREGQLYLCNNELEQYDLFVWDEPGQRWQRAGSEPRQQEPAVSFAEFMQMRRDGKYKF